MSVASFHQINCTFKSPNAFLEAYIDTLDAIASSIAHGEYSAYTVHAVYFCDPANEYMNDVTQAAMERAAEIVAAQDEDERDLRAIDLIESYGIDIPALTNDDEHRLSAAQLGVGTYARAW